MCIDNPPSGGRMDLREHPLTFIYPWGKFNEID